MKRYRYHTCTVEQLVNNGLASQPAANQFLQTMHDQGYRISHVVTADSNANGMDKSIVIFELETELSPASFNQKPCAPFPVDHRETPNHPIDMFLRGTPVVYVPYHAPTAMSGDCEFGVVTQTNAMLAFVQFDTGVKQCSPARLLLAQDLMPMERAHWESKGKSFEKVDFTSVSS